MHLMGFSVARRIIPVQSRNPFTFLPENQRAISIADGSITSQFLEAFGRPARDTGQESERNNQPTDSQRLQLLNSSYVEQKIERGGKLDLLLRQARTNPGRSIDTIYLTILSRHPSTEETALVQKYFRDTKSAAKTGPVDLAWALINTKEFLYKH